MTSLPVSISNLVFDNDPPFCAPLSQAYTDAQTTYLASLNTRLAERYGQGKIPHSTSGDDGSVIDVKPKRAYIFRIARRLSTAYHLRMIIASTSGYSLDIVINSGENDAPSSLSTTISPSQDDNNSSEAFALISQLATDVVAEYQACLDEGGLPTFASREGAEDFFAHTETVEEFEFALGTWAASQAKRMVDDESSTYHQLRGVLLSINGHSAILKERGEQSQAAISAWLSYQ